MSLYQTISPLTLKPQPQPQPQPQTEAEAEAENPNSVEATKRYTRLRLEGMNKARQQKTVEIFQGLFPPSQRQQREIYWKLRYWWESGENKLLDLAAQEFCQLSSLETFDPEMIANLQSHAETLGLSRDISKMGQNFKT